MKKRDVRFDLIRTLGVLMVLVNHTIASELMNCTSVGQQWFCSFAMVFSRLGVPLFLMLSGTLLLDEKRDYSSVKLLIERILKVLIPLVCWSIIYFVLYDFIMYKDATLGGFLSLLFGPGKAGHLWYLYELIVLYLFLPFSSAIVKQCNTRVIGLLVLVWFWSSGMYHFVGEIIGTGIWSMYVDLHILNGLWGYFFLGWFVKKVGIKYQQVLMIIATILFMVCVVWLVYECKRTENVSFAIVSYSGAPIIIISGVLFSLLVNKKRVTVRNRFLISVEKISDLSFGIYLNQLLARAIANKCLDFLNFGEIAYLFALFFITTVLSICMAGAVSLVSKKYKFAKILFG